MVSRLKTFNLITVVLVIALCGQAWAVRILNPGDTVKGKKIQNYYFCYTEEEQAKVLEYFRELDKYKAIVELKDKQIALMGEATSTQVAKVQLLNEKIRLLEAALSGATKREIQLVEEVKKRDGNITALRRKAKRNLFLGGLFGIGSVCLGAEVSKR